MVQGGYMGKYLVVDMTTGEIETKEWDEQYLELYIGGPALGARMLWDLMPAHTDALAPESVFGFLASPLNGTNALFGGRYTVVSKSPVTNGFNDANSGGYFGPELKKAGFDALFIKGRSEKPAYLLITDDKCEIRDASHVWGKDYYEAEAIVRDEVEAELGVKNVRTAGIGPAGERGSHIAALMNDMHHTAGRGGSAAVLGAKGVKMVAVKGTKKIPIADPDKLNEMKKGYLTALKEADVQFFKDHGSGEAATACILGNDASTRNWSAVGADYYTPEEAEKLGAPWADERYKTKSKACAACPFGCGALYKVEDGAYPIGDTTRPQYETIAAFSSNILVKDPAVNIYANDLCNRAGIDTISAGGTVAWAIEAFENGDLTEADTDGIKLAWGDGDAAIQLLKKMCSGEGCGKYFQHGTKYACEALGGRGAQFMTVFSGIEPGQHDPRLMPGLGRAYVWDPVPGRHVKGTTGYIIEDDKYNFEEGGPHTGAADVEATSYTELESAAGFCQFGGIYGSQFTAVEDCEAVTGLSIDMEKYGPRSFLMRLAFSVREGIERKDYTFNPRNMGDPALPGGPTEGKTIPVVTLGERFYEALGCDMEHFWPYKDTLLALGGLDDVAAEIGLDRP